MKRIKILGLFLTIIVSAVIFGITAGAKETTLPDGLLICDENGINVEGTGDYFLYIDDIEEKDVISRTILIQNYGVEGTYDLYLIAEPMETTGPVDLLNSLHLNIAVGESTLYSGRLRGDGADTASLKGNGKDMINDSLYIGKYGEGDRGSIEICISEDADKVSLAQFDQKSTADIKWIFLAIKDADAQPPKTGDAIDYILYSIIALIIIAIIVIYKRYKKIREDIYDS